MASGSTLLLQTILLLALAVYSSYGGCTFSESWTGSWFQSGYPGLIAINRTHIFSKGECSETESFDKFLLYDRGDDCYRCMVIHEKHKHVLQYKETYCSQKDSLASICESISGDAPLYSMFRKEPRPRPETCPFHPAPFTFTYSRGSGDCANPPSRAEACTDDSRLLLRYMACPDVPGTESNVEELVCLATWKEGSTRYLVGQISQVRRNTIASDEDTYRCFIYKGQHNDKSMTYYIAQSGDATCNGLSSPTDGSRTMKLTNSDDEHNRCHFPSWIVEHHKWYTLDETHQYHFTTKNATLKVMSADGLIEEKRLVCHSILEQRENQHIKVVAHVTQGCESGHVCLWVWRRGGGALEVGGAGGGVWESPQDACAQAAPDHYVTLVNAKSLVPARCPLAGRYSVVNSLADRRLRRQQLRKDDTEESSVAECVSGDYDRVEVGCGAGQHTMEFKSHCASTVYTCYVSWWEGSRGFLVAGVAGGGGGEGGARGRTLCFMYTLHAHNDSSPAVIAGGAGGAGGGGGSSAGLAGGAVSLSGALHACDRAVLPGHGGDKAYNLTLNGTCEQSSKYNSGCARAAPAAIFLAAIPTLAVLALR